MSEDPRAGRAHPDGLLPPDLAALLDGSFVTACEIEALTGSWWRTQVDSSTTVFTREMFERGIRRIDEGRHFEELERFRSELAELPTSEVRGVPRVDRREAVVEPLAIRGDDVEGPHGSFGPAGQLSGESPGRRSFQAVVVGPGAWRRRVERMGGRLQGLRARRVR